MMISKGASAAAIRPQPMITVEKRELSQVRIPSYLIDTLSRQSFRFKEALVNFAALVQPCGSQLLTGRGDLEVAAPSQTHFLFVTDCRLARHSAVHPAPPALFSCSYPPLLPNSGWGKCSRKKWPPINKSLRFYTFDPSRNRILLRTAEFSSPGRRDDSCCKKASE